LLPSPPPSPPLPPLEPFPLVARTTITIVRIRITIATPPIIKYCFFIFGTGLDLGKPIVSAFIASPPIS